MLLGESLTRTFSITNNGTDVLNIINVESDFIRYTISSPPADTVAVGESTSFDVTFTPAIVGVILGRITITSNDPDENPYTCDLTATGQDEVIFANDFEQPPP